MKNIAKNTKKYGNAIGEYVVQDIIPNSVVLTQREFDIWSTKGYMVYQSLSLDKA